MTVSNGSPRNGGEGGKEARTSPRPNLRHHRILLDLLVIICDPIDEPFGFFTKLLRRHVKGRFQEVLQNGLLFSILNGFYGIRVAVTTGIGRRFCCRPIRLHLVILSARLLGVKTCQGTTFSRAVNACKLTVPCCRRHARSAQNKRFSATSVVVQICKLVI